MKRFQLRQGEPADEAAYLDRQIQKDADGAAEHSVGLSHCRIFVVLSVFYEQLCK